MHPYKDNCTCYDCILIRVTAAYNVYDPFSDSNKFKAKYPPPKQKIKVKYSGEYRRIHDAAFDVINWQYRPWPSATWETYYTVTLEALQRLKNNDYATVMTSKTWIKAADKALSERRFYKIERVDETA